MKIIKVGALTRSALLILLASLILTLGCSGGNLPTSPSQDQSEDRSLGGPEAVAIITTETGAEYIAGEVLVVLEDEYSGKVDENVLADWPLKSLRTHRYTWTTLYVLGITDGTSVPEMVARLEGDTRVKIAEPNFIYHAMESPYTPNDPMWESDDDGDDPMDSVYDQWGPAKIGANIVWNELNGSDEIIVAVLDTGVRFDHEDLNANIWINEDEDPNNGIDDDDNGYIDDWWGWDAVEDENNPMDDPGIFSSYHGTSCAGVVAAVQDNERGVTGMAPGVKIMVGRCLGAWGGSNEGITNAINYATVNDADIISMSLGGTSYSELIEGACDAAWDDGNGRLVIAAAGNSDTTAPMYPASYDSVMAVAAVAAWNDSNNPVDEQRLTPSLGYDWGSNYGDQIVISGYGSKYISTYGAHYSSYRDGIEVDFFGGTSNACPMSVGVMALIRSYYPDRELQWYWDRIKDTADDLDVPGWDINTGHGRVNAVRAIYGSDRFTDLEDADGFVPLELPGAEIYDTIHDVESNPYEDKADFYRIPLPGGGDLAIRLDVFTFGENIDLALYSDLEMTNMVAESTTENHAGTSFEEIDFPDADPGEYFLKVYSPAVGNSSIYGLKVDNLVTFDLVGTDIGPASLPAGGSDVPFLKLELTAGGLVIVDQIAISAFGTLPLQNIAALGIYDDTDGSGDFDPAEDSLVTSVSPVTLNRVKFNSLGLEVTAAVPRTVFVVADLNSPLLPSTFRLSVETYKDVVTLQNVEAPYDSFPVVSKLCTLGD